MFSADFFQKQKSFFSSLAILLVLAIGLIAGSSEEKSEAANPTFWLSTLATDASDFPTSLGLELDPTAEGTGALAAEAHISYDSNKVTVNSVSFGTCIFDSCIDLSEEGSIKVLGASGKPENGGTLVTSQSQLATISLNFSESTTLTFTKCQVINQAEELKSCTSTNVTYDPGTTCGDGVVEGAETCDDGNINDGDGCSASCQIEAVCGNGTVEGAEECDDNNTNNGDGCSSTCELETVCGDGTMEGVEQCDDGNVASEDGCSAVCMLEVCGDGVQQIGLGEACDDGNTENGDGCSATCADETAAVCGNGAVESGEVCDDGNASNLDACLNTCVTASCGDNHVQTGVEQCDDGNTNNGDGCSATCNLETTCGDGNTEGVEQCDDGNDINTDACTNVCMTATCGDSFTHAGVEQCDDGNNEDNDGCSALCELEAIENPVCGNNIVEGSEQCDDGNNISGDGCSAICDNENPQLTSLDTYIGTGFSSTIAVDDFTQLATFAFFDNDLENGVNVTTPTESNPIIYSSNNNGVASALGDRVYGIGQGFATITASYTVDGITQSDTVNVTVIQANNCGNGLLNDGEQCDDGNTETEVCGYGQTSCSVCSASCQNVEGSTSFCGDGTLHEADGEVCDDGNNENGDGCSATCTVEEEVVEEVEEEPAAEEEAEEEVEDEAPVEEVEEEVVEEVEEEPVVEEEVEEVVDEEAPVEVPADTRGGEVVTIEQLEEQLKPAALENQEAIEEQAAQEAEAIIEAVEPEKEAAVTIEVPETQEEQLSRIDICKQANPELNFDDRTADADLDGLSNRVECYSNTNPLVPDTDNDQCNDGDEVNQLYSDPNRAGDCKFVPQVVIQVTETGEEVEVIEPPKVVLISDPQPGWILGDTSPRVSAIIPVGTKRATAIAIPSNQKVIKALIIGVENLMAAEGVTAIQEAINALAEPIGQARQFLNTNQDFFSYEGYAATLFNVEKAISDLSAEIEAFQASQAEEEEVVEEGAENEADEVVIEPAVFTSEVNLEQVLEQLNADRIAPISLGSTLSFSETFLGEDQPALRFEFVSSTQLADGQLYDLIVEAELTDGELLHSTPVRFGINSGLAVREPVPRSLGDVLLPGGVAFNDLMIANVVAQGDGYVEVEIDETRPTVSGDSEFGSQVFAIWNSVVLASSTLSDSEEGEFEIQAPRNLEADSSHRLTLYAVKQDGESKLRSESVDVFFRIKGAPAFNPMPYAIGLGVLIVLAVALIMVRRLMKRKQQEGPVEGILPAGPTPELLRAAAPETPSDEGEPVAEQSAEVVEQPEATVEPEASTETPAAPEQPVESAEPTGTAEQPAAAEPNTAEGPVIRPLPESSAPVEPVQSEEGRAKIPTEFDRDPITDEEPGKNLGPDQATESLEQEPVVEAPINPEQPATDQPEKPTADQPSDDEKPTS